MNSPTAPTTGQAGELDNVLRISPGDHPEIKDWEDGKNYRITDALIRQISPGEFELVGRITVTEAGDGAQAQQEAETPPEDAGETGEEAPPEPPAISTNPAINKLIASRKR